MWVGNVSTYSNKLTVSWDIVLLFLNTKLFPPPWGTNSEFWTCLFLSLMLFMFHLPAAIFPKSYPQWNGRMPTQAKQGFSLLFSNQNRMCRLCLCITPPHFFRGIATREINSPEERVHLWPYNRRFPQNIGERAVNPRYLLFNKWAPGFQWIYVSPGLMLF